MKGKRSMMNLDLLHNKYVLYFSFLIAVISVGRYLMIGNFESVAIFLLIGFLTTYFSKNMIVILLTSTISTNLISMLRRKQMRWGYLEGMTNEGSSSQQVDASGSVVPSQPAPVPPAVASATATPSAPAAPAPPASPAVANPPATPIAQQGSPAQQGFSQQQKNSKKESMTTLSPAPIGEELKNPMGNMSYGNSINQKKEQMMDALSGITGGNGGLMLNPDTSKLVQQQTDLMNNLKGLEPLLKTAQGFLDKFESSPLLSGMVKSLTGISPNSNQGPVGALS